MFKIHSIYGRSILDSRGNPTAEVDCVIIKDECKYLGRGVSPSGASVGSKEALELRDSGSHKYLGMGVESAVNNINTVIRNAIIGKTFNSFQEFDKLLIELDGTENKNKLGANGILACSIAFLKSLSNSLNQPLFKTLKTPSLSRFKTPLPMMNMINGGIHADNLLDIQEVMIIPKSAVGIKEQIRVAAEVFHTLKSILRSDGLSINVGDEGGFAPNIKSVDQALDLLLHAIEKAGYVPGIDVEFALDVAASELSIKDGSSIKNIKYKIDNNSYSSSELISYYQKLISNYPIVSIEDPFSEDDILGWREFTETFGNKIQIVGDDLFVTNAKILKNGITGDLANAILIKMNQIGTLTETLETVLLADNNNYTTIVSHRSGETEDTTIAHLSVAIGSKFIKAGSVSRTDRTCKYNELIRIAEVLDVHNEIS